MVGRWFYLHRRIGGFRWRIESKNRAGNIQLLPLEYCVCGQKTVCEWEIVRKVAIEKEKKVRKRKMREWPRVKCEELWLCKMREKEK